MDFSQIAKVIDLTTTLPVKQAVATAVVDFINVVTADCNSDDPTKRATAQGLMAVMAGQVLK